MIETYISSIAGELGIKPQQVSATAELLDAEATVPFIARYRKEATGSLDEVVITAIRDRLAQLRELDKRRDSILKSLDERELLTDELRDKITAAESLTVLEDIYLPYRPKRRTRATAAKEKGLEPLAVVIFDQDPGTVPAKEADAFIDPEKGVETIEAALAGARDIMAEWINEHQEARSGMRAFFERGSVFNTRVVPGREEDGAKFRDYFDWVEPIDAAPSHRILAMRRGETEKVLYLSLKPDEEKALAILENMFVKGEGPASEEVRLAVHDCYRRLLSLSMETEMRLSTKQRADEEAIKVFADNLRELLLASPLGQKRVLAIDPGFRTGCKVVCLDAQGQLIHYDTINILGSEQSLAASAEKIKKLIEIHGPEAIAVGNGTGGRETVAFVKKLECSQGIPVVMVNESGASIYSASEAARQEFPDLDLVYRGAVSIGRRLTDPLAELVKIDPKSIGVGQYQHDVNQTQLKKCLDDVVISCVNAVGVEVNTASQQLLTYVSGLGPQLAGNIIAYRNENGPFPSRKKLLKVPRLGPKAFEQAAGFLRIRDGENPLDASAVHPESYKVVEEMARDLSCSIKDLLGDDAVRQGINLKNYITDKVGLPTLSDIMAELAKPGRDPREAFQTFAYAEGVESIGDLEPGMKLPGVVTNVTAFGAFVDVGVHQDGLVHVSQLADHFVKDPHKIVKVHQQVTVTVLDVDLDRNRISLSLRENPEESRERPRTGPSQPKKKHAGKKEKRGDDPFNNPFAKAFKK